MPHNVHVARENRHRIRQTDRQADEGSVSVGVVSMARTTAASEGKCDSV